MNKQEISNCIKNWIEHCYGKTELESPSWDIELLSEELYKEMLSATAKKTNP
jgi:hypothetical protein